MKDPKFSIIIPTYNRANLLKRCLESVKAQTFTDWEAIVVDNFSEDNTEQVVNDLNDNRIIYIKNHNYGVISVSRNKGLDIAQGEYVCFLDSDDCWLPQKLECLLPYIADYDLIYHNLKFNIPNPKPFQRRTMRFYDIKESTVAYVLQRGDPLSPSCSCISRATIGDTRFSEEKNLIAAEDYDFFLQIIHKNIRIKYLKKYLTLYDVSGCSHDGNGPKRDSLILEKWGIYLNEAEKKEANLQYFRRVADTKRSNGEYREARQYYYKLLGSKIIFKKVIGLRGLILCYYHSILS